MRITSPEAVGMSSDRLAHIMPTMQKFIDNDLFAGLATLVARRGQIIHASTVGYRDKEAGAVLQDDTIYRIYSMTKPITSIALMQLYEQGKFLLTDPVSKYIPALSKAKVYDGGTVDNLRLVEQSAPMTIQHLLTHTSGLGYGLYFDSPIEELYRKAPRFDPNNTFETMTDRLATIPLAFQPGCGWRYSMATDVCGYLVQLISGIPFDTYLAEHIFQPLGMIDTHFTVPADKLDRFSAIYTYDSDGQLQSLDPNPEYLIRDYTIPTYAPSGGGGLVSTMADYLNFCTMLMNRGEFNDMRIIGRKTLDYMARNHLPANLLPYRLGDDVRHGYGFGLGFRVLLDATQTGLIGSDGEYGWAGAANTYFWIDPQEELLGVFMNQFMSSGERPQAREIFQALVYQALVD